MNNLENIKGVIGYKVVNPDWTCRNNFKYEVGKTYKHEGEIGVCKEGFHFCRKLISCFKYYPFDTNNKVAIIVATGEIIDGEDKSVTDDITILKELNWHEVLDMVNSGKNNTGLGNSGDYNSGYFNSGNYNSGYYNSGNRNSGDCNTGNRNTEDCNTGDYNTGYFNSGNCNTGNRNSGDFNTGDYNTGDFNTCNHSTGIFNTEEDKIKIFNKPSNWTYQNWINSDSWYILSNVKLTKWITVDDMTEEEKEQHPQYKTTGGYLKKYEYKEACKNMWNELTEEERNIIMTELPNFDKDIFKEITGIDVDEK